MSESAPFYTRFGLQAAIVFQRERRPWTGAIEKTFSEIIKAGFVLFEQTPAPRRANLRFGTAPALNRRIPSNREGVMKNQESEDAANAAIGAAAKAATSGWRQAMPSACVADARQSTRTFLTDTLEGFGFATRECARLAALGAALDARAPDLVVIGSSAGGIEACEMMEMLAAKDYDGKVLVLGPRTSPMVAAVRALGKTLGLAMLPLLATPFSAGTLGDAVASLLHAKAAPDPRAPELWYQPKLDARTLALSGAAARAAAGDPSERIEHDGGSRSAARSERVMAWVAEDWRSFHAHSAAVEIALELPLAFFRDPASVATLCRQLPDHRAFAGLIIEINAAAAVRELGLVKAIAKQLRFRNIAISIRDVGEEWVALSKLHDFPFVELKLDRRLVAGCAHDRAKLTTCRHIIDFADGMGARTVAEGVENRADFIAVREIGVHLVQGGLFAAPMPAKKFARTVLARETSPR
jgi:EAL domain-containing protein (putative c-di-GMP-specific phosphodiesterase class I)